jgi:hypothetical protein
MKILVRRFGSGYNGRRLLALFKTGDVQYCKIVMDKKPVYQKALLVEMPRADKAAIKSLNSKSVGVKIFA